MKLPLPFSFSSFLFSPSLPLLLSSGRMWGNDIWRDPGQVSERVCSTGPRQVPLSLPQGRVIWGPCAQARTCHHGELGCCVGGETGNVSGRAGVASPIVWILGLLSCRGKGGCWEKGLVGRGVRSVEGACTCIASTCTARYLSVVEYFMCKNLMSTKILSCTNTHFPASPHPPILWFCKVFHITAHHANSYAVTIDPFLYVLLF